MNDFNYDSAKTPHILSLGGKRADVISRRGYEEKISLDIERGTRWGSITAAPKNLAAKPAEVKRRFLAES